ncbi:MAG: hypothetical protein R3D63_09445 [Paracoccaceae bacterium]
MALFPAAVIVILLWLVLVIRDPDTGVVATLAVVPMGMFAAANLGGLSILVLHLLAAMTIAVLGMRWMYRSGGHISRAIVTPATGFLLLFALYSLFSAIVLVRYFAGQFLVFPMNVTSTGLAISTFFLSTMTPLAPGSSNIAQSGYILLTCVFFIAALDVFVRRAPRFGEGGLEIAAALNILLGILDLMSLDPLLSVIRTADYSLLNEHNFNGVPRVIGGYSEASGFGTASAAFFGYFITSFLIRRRPGHGWLALGSLVCALMSLSSSGIVAATVACILVLLHGPVYLGRGMSRAFGHWFVIVVSLGFAVLCLLMLSPAVAKSVESVLDWLIFSKAGSESGLERSAWARAGLQAFVDTNGLGAGAGSLRSNGLAAVLLGSVGLPGTLCFAGFLLTTLLGSRHIADEEDRRVFYAARVTALTLLSALLISATTPNPTVFLVAMAALCTAARKRSHDPHHRAVLGYASSV